MGKVLLICFIFLFSIQVWFASEKQSFFAGSLSTTELWEYIKKLKDDQKEFKEKSKELSKEYGELISFMRTDLSWDEIKEIKENIEIFIDKRIILQSDLKEKINQLLDVEKEKKELILLRANIYKYLSRYVARDKREAFLEHIKFQVQSEKESKDLIEEIQKSQNILDQKVTYFKEKIENHKEDLQARIETSITQKIKERIDEIDKNEKYKDIDRNTKNKIYNDFIAQLQSNIWEISGSNLSDNYKEMRKNILNKMIEEIKLRIK